MALFNQSGKHFWVALGGFGVSWVMAASIVFLLQLLNGASECY